MMMGSTQYKGLKTRIKNRLVAEAEQKVRAERKLAEEKAVAKKTKKTTKVEKKKKQTKRSSKMDEEALFSSESE